MKTCFIVLICLSAASCCAAQTPPANQPTAKVLPTKPTAYTVVSGDTLVSISKIHYGTPDHWNAILQANHGQLPGRMLKVGLKLSIPTLEQFKN